MRNGLDRLLFVVVMPVGCFRVFFVRLSSMKHPLLLSRFLKLSDQQSAERILPVDGGPKTVTAGADDKIWIGALDIQYVVA